jgi:transposase-like protein
MHAIDTPCPHCGRQTIGVHEVTENLHSVSCSWLECHYSVAVEGDLDTAVKFAHRRTDKEKLRIVSLLRDALHIIETGEIVPDGRTVTYQVVKMFKHKCEEFFGENGKYKPRKQ